jgi:hypothetical protein
MLRQFLAVVLGWSLDEVVFQSVVLVFRCVGRVGDWAEIGCFSFQVVAAYFVEVFG